MDSRDPSADQLVSYKKYVQVRSRLTTKTGAPIGIKTAIETVGKNGPVLLQDVYFLDEISAFDRERIPERVVHAKGAGAFGDFEVTHDITKYCASKIFDTLGKKTPIAVRFSTVAGENGSADTVRNPRGFALKFYIEDGNWDLVGNNTPIFFIRDPSLFPSLIHSHKRNPATHLKDADMFWDFMTLRPETMHQLLYMMGDRGIPDGYRYMNGYGSHTFKLINAQGVAHWCKFHYKSNQGLKHLTVEKAAELASSDPDYSIKDLYNAIARGDFPSWTLYVQVMTMAEAEKCKFNPFDVTKVWPHSDYPLIPVGKFTLNRNPKNYFSEVEQIAFSPANLVSGIEPSPDKLLQGRLFSYSDAQRYRLGANFLQIPVNCPFSTKVANFQRDGPHNISNQEGSPNYFPNSFTGPHECPRVRRLLPKYNVSGDVGRYDIGETEDNFTQAAALYQKVFDEGEKVRVVNNIVGSLKGAAGFIQDRAIKVFNQIDKELANRVKAGLVPYKKFHSSL